MHLLCNTASSRSKVATVGEHCASHLCADPSLLYLESLRLLFHQLQCPSLLVKVMIPPLSPASISLYPSLSYLHIKLHLTSISVMESGASGSFLTTTQHLPASPSPANPPSHSPSRAQPLHSCSAVPDKMLHFCMKGLHLLLHPLFICSFPAALICALLKRLHAAESILNAEEREDSIINIRGCVQYVCFNH